MVWFADITVENRPMMISSYTVPEASGSFCQRGGRFGAHSSNESMTQVYYKKMAFISFFNAGVRALDIRDPYHPTEVGYFIPAITAATDKRCVKIDGKDRCKVGSRPTMSKPTSAATSTSSTAPIPACTFLN